MAAEKHRPIRQALVKWYLANKRDLPWRKTRDPYRIWVSEVMLQQTQVNTVIPYFHKFIARFPDVQALAASDLQSVLKMWEGLGYYGRARNLHKAAGIVVREHGGVIPDTADNIRQLPGVGEYISAAVLSIAYNLPLPVVDGNVKRVLARLFLLDAPVNHPGAHPVFREKAGQLMDAAVPAVYNQALMELGALVCRPRHPQCAACPLQNHCLAFRDSRVAEFPRRKKGKKLPKHALAAGVVIKNSRLLITRRPENGLLGGLWEFPNGPIDTLEAPDAACLRHVKTMTGVTAEIDAFVGRIRHAYTHFKLTMNVYACQYVSGRVRLTGPSAYRWVAFDEIGAYPLPKVIHKSLPALFNVLKP